VLAPATGVLLLATGQAGWLPVPLMMAASAVLCAAPLALLLATGMQEGRDGGRTVQGAGLLVAGMLIQGFVAAGAGLAAQFRPEAIVVDVPLSAEISLVGLFFMAGAYLLGLLQMPGPELTLVGRVRRLLDGASIGICLFFIAWLLLFGELGLLGAGLTAVLLASVTMSVAVTAGLRAAGYQPGALRSGVGAALSIAGLTGLTVVLDYHRRSGWVLLFGVVLVVAPILIWQGVDAVARTGPPGPIDEGRRFAAYPLLTLPLAGALVVAGYHFVQQHRFDTVSVVLSVAGIAVIALRESFTALDIRRYAARLALQHANFQSLVSGASEVTLVLDNNLLVRWQSIAAARQFGLSDQEVIGRSVLALVHPDDAERVAARLAAEHTDPFEARLRDGFSTWRDTEWSIGGQRLTAAAGTLVLYIRDIEPRRELARTVRRAASADRLTGLANRDELHRVLADAGAPGALIVLDLGGVTGVNEVHGHRIGDAVMVEAARRLRAEAAPTDVPVRLDGDKFAVATGSGAVQAHLLATRLLTILTEPYALPGTLLHLSASAGLAELQPGVPAGETLRRAGLALRGTRRGFGGGAVEWYDESTEAQLRRRLNIEQELPGAVGRAELDLAYQPIVDLASGRPVGAEALLRWRHPRLGTVPPGEFIPIAEELGLLDEVGQWVLHWACRQLSGWLRDDRDVWVSVNVSAGQLVAPTFVATVGTALDTHQVPASRLVIEVAEPGIVAGPVGGLARTEDTRMATLVSHLGELRSMGVRTAVDHFGTASTSLSQLRILPLDLLKVDRQIFAEPAGRSGVVTAIIDVVVKLGVQIGVEVIAQGLETEADLEVARAAGCHFGQGYLLSWPVPPEHLEAWLDGHRSQLT
jgi:diguanylate cyclase (GGDEF)-like protein/PAS domain S-box-containing protein